MTRDDIIRMADEADLWADQELQCIGEYHPDWHEVRDIRFAALVAAAERKAIYDNVMFETLKDPDLLMPETEVDENAVDDYFKSSEFRYAVNNVVKATIFTILSNIRARGQQ